MVMCNEECQAVTEASSLKARVASGVGRAIVDSCHQLQDPPPFAAEAYQPSKDPEKCVDLPSIPWHFTLLVRAFESKKIRYPGFHMYILCAVCLSL